MSQKLTQDQADMIRMFSEFGFSKPQLAREYHVHTDTVRNVLNGLSFTGDTRKKDFHHQPPTDEQVRFIKEQAREGHKEQAIATMLRGVVARATVRQVLDGKNQQGVG